MNDPQPPGWGIREGNRHRQVGWNEQSSDSALDCDLKRGTAAASADRGRYRSGYRPVASSALARNRLSCSSFYSTAIGLRRESQSQNLLQTCLYLTEGGRTRIGSTNMPC